MTTVSVIVVDDHPLFRAGLRALLATRSDFTVVGEAHNGEEALQMARDLRPDLVLMDIRMPRMGGLEATKAIKREFPQMRVVMITVSEEAEDLFEAVKAGAQGYIVKNLASNEVLDLIRRAADGEAAFTPALASRTLLLLGGQKSGKAEELTAREREVLEQLVLGHRNADIAKHLGLTEATVRFHLSNILSKLHARSRTEAAVKAVQQRIVTTPPDQARRP
ncbi:MAG: response regulator transcription factor [Armatimonadetes bacterium]|nr:response regulator transcription factor [Armatimonadota bacterium]